MDIATHALLGATAGYALGGQRLGRYSALIGALGAAIPDLDVVLRNADDPLLALELHRHFSHSLLFAVGASIAIGLLVQRFFSRATRVQTIGLVLAGYLSAVLLDACTSYGTHLFWPFSDARIALSIISIVDPLFSGALLIALLIGLLRKSVLPTALALMFCVCYLGFSTFAQHRASALLSDAMSTRHPELIHTLVKPSFGNVIVWRGLAWDDTHIATAALRPGWLSASRVIMGERIPRPTQQQLTRWSGQSPTHKTDVQRFARLSNQLLIIHPSRPDLLGDARFALMPDSLEPLWGIQVNPMDATGHVSYVTNRNMTRARRTHFINLLLGRDVP